MKKTAKRGKVRWTHMALAVLFCFLSAFTVYTGYLSRQFFAEHTTMEQTIEEPFSVYVQAIENPLNSYLRGAEKLECPKMLLPQNTNFRFTARDENGEIILSTYDENDSVLYQSYHPLSLTVQGENGQETDVTFTVDCYLLEEMNVHDIFYRTLLLRQYFRIVDWSCDVLSILFAIACLLLVFRLIYGAGCEAGTSNGGQSVLLSVPPDILLASSLPFGAFLTLLFMRGVNTDDSIRAFLENGTGILDLLRMPLLYTGVFVVVLLLLLSIVFSLRRGGVRYALTYLRFEKASLSIQFYIGYTAMQIFKCAGIALYLFAYLRLEQFVQSGGTLAPSLPQSVYDFFLLSDGVHARIRTVTALLYILLEKAVTLPMVFRCIREVRRQTEQTEKYVLGDLTETDSGTLYKNFADHKRDVRSITDRISASAGEYIQSKTFKAELITNLSHDIKTPLTAIMSYAQLLRSPTLTSEEKMQCLDVLKRHSVRMTNLVESLTEISDAASGNITAALTAVDLCALLSQAVQGFAERLHRENIAVQLNLPTEPVTVTADVGLLWRVADNLLNNICKYAQKGTTAEIAVCIRDDTAVAEFRNVSAFELHISGEALMERFVRADASRHTEGSGLGLSIAHSLMQLQNGSLRIQTEPQTFTAQMVLPIQN